MIYYHCEACGRDLGENDTELQRHHDGTVTHEVSYCCDCGFLCTEHDTETDRDTIHALTERAEKAESVLRSFRKEWGKIDTYRSHYDGEIRHSPIAVGVGVDVALQAQEIVGGEWVREWESEVHP